MGNLLAFLTVFGLAIAFGRISSGITTAAEHADSVKNEELKIAEGGVVRPKRYMTYYDDDEYSADEAWTRSARAWQNGGEIHEWWNGTHYVKTRCIPSGKTCIWSGQCCTYDCHWLFTSAPGPFQCAPGICPFSDGTYRPCLVSNHDKYVVEYNAFSPNRPLYPPPGKPVTPWG